MSAYSWCCRNPFQGGMGFFTFRLKTRPEPGAKVAIPFRVGWDFSPGNGSLEPKLPSGVAIPFRVGWDFSLRLTSMGSCRRKCPVAIPFRVGWDFSRKEETSPEKLEKKMSQSLSGWDGIFHKIIALQPGVYRVESQSLSGWDGIFH